MPQLDITTYLPQLFWLAISFGLLYFLMVKYGLPRIGEILEDRQNRLDVDLEKAENFKVESEKLEADYDQLTAKARADAQSHLKAEREKLDASLDVKRADMSAKMDKKFAEAEAGINKAKDDVLDDLETIASEACVSIVAQLSGRKLSTTEAKKAVKASLQNQTD